MTQPINDDQPSIVLNQLVVESGVYPSSGNSSGGVPIGFIRTFANTFNTPIAANNQQEAQGQVLTVNNNTDELFSVIGTTYGSNSQITFDLPNLAGRVAVGSGGGGPSLGQSYGQDTVTLTPFNMPVSGGDQPFDNDQPSLGVNYMINVGGVYGNGASENAIGMVLPFLGTGTPGGYMPADGQILNIRDHTALFSIIGTSYGGNGQTTFALPNLDGRTIVGAGVAPDGASLSVGQVVGSDLTTVASSNLPAPQGSDTPINNSQPSLALTYMICTSGAYPLPNQALSAGVSYLGEIMAFAGSASEIPTGWTLAAGQILSIRQNTSLFSLIGNSYGGDGQSTFALPNLQGRDVVGVGTGPSGASYATSETFGGDITLNTSEVVNDQAPTVTIGASGYSTSQQQPLILKGTGLSVGDVDGGNGVETLTLKVSAGILNAYVFNTGVTVQSGYDTSDLVLTGTITQLQDLLSTPDGSNLSYDADADTPSSVTLTLSLDDNGFTGLNGPLTATASTTIDVTPCYCAGTLIETKNGEVAVEMLKIGDLIQTASGTFRPIKWIGRRSYGGRYILGRKDILPICIKAGALDENVPRRDLWISPHHAMYLDGVLIEAKDLVNESSVVQAEGVAEIAYFHIELETHDVIIAEGALSETFVDDDNRGMFHNAHDYAALYSESEHQPTRYCAPRLDHGYKVETIRHRIARRAGIECGSKTGAVHGFIDRVSLDCIAGWAQNLDHPEAPVCLDIFTQGRLIGQVLANTYRDDLQKAGIGSGRHAFAFTPPDGTTFAPDTVEVRRSLDGASLRNFRTLEILSGREQFTPSFRGSIAVSN